MPSQLLSPEGVWKAVHGRPAAGREQNGLRLDQNVLAVAHVDQQHAGERVTVGGQDEFQRPMLFQSRDAARPHLLRQAIDDLDAGQVALVHGAIEGLAGERFLVDRAVGIAIEKTADLVFELVNALDRAGDQRPGEVLIREPFAALDRVHEVALDRVAGGERDVVASLNHARAAAFAEQTLDRDGDRQRRVRRLCVQRGEQARAARAQNENVGAKTTHALTHVSGTSHPASQAPPRACRAL